MSTYRIGPGEDCDFPGFPELLSAGVLAGGDVVEVMTGKVYKAAQKYIYPTPGAKDPITFRGISDENGRRPFFDGRGKSLDSPRAFFELYGSQTGQGTGDGAWVVENLEFMYAKNNDSDMNAAAVRNVNTSVRVRGCKIWNMAAGVMSSNQSKDTIIEDCDIGWCGYGDGHSHNIYVDGERFQLRNSRIHDSTMGQNVKTRNRFVDISYNQIFYSRDGEIGIIQTGSGQPADDPISATSQPGSNALVCDNEIVTRSDRGDGNRATVITMGKDMGTVGRNGTLFLHGNKISCQNAFNEPVRLSGSRSNLDARHNKFLGVSPMVVTVRDEPGKITGELNWISPDAETPDQFVNPAAYYYAFGEGASEVSGNTAPGSRRLHSAIQAPTGFRDWDDQGGLGFEWNPVPGALFYRVWRYLLQNGKPANSNTVWGGATEPRYVDIFQNYPSKEGKRNQYVYRVTAIDLNGSQSALSAKWIKEHGQPGYAG